MLCLVGLDGRSGERNHALEDLVVLAPQPGRGGSDGGAVSPLAPLIAGGATDAAEAASTPRQQARRRPDVDVGGAESVTLADAGQTTPARAAGSQR